MQVHHLVTNVLGTYRDCGITGLLAFLVGTSLGLGDFWLDNEEFESTGWPKLNCPLLILCGHDGQVLWMSAHGRAVLGTPGRLEEAFWGRQAVLVWQVWQAAEGVVVGALLKPAVADRPTDLAPLQAALIGHFFRLLVAERRLSAKARLSRPGSGRKAIRQMEMERRRLGRELHTGAGQMLAAIRLQLDLIAAEMEAPTPGVRQALDRIGTLAQDTLEQVRSLSKRLHPPEWQRLALVEAIGQLWHISGIPQRFEASLDLESLPAEPDLEVKTLMYRALQEALSNLVRHSRASRVAVSLKLSDHVLTLTVVDNGVGFDVQHILQQPAGIASGIGLRSIREQSEALGARMSIQSGPSGTTLRVSVALPPTLS